MQTRKHFPSNGRQARTCQIMKKQTEMPFNNGVESYIISVIIWIGWRHYLLHIKVKNWKKNMKLEAVNHTPSKTHGEEDAKGD